MTIPNAPRPEELAKQLIARRAALWEEVRAEMARSGDKQYAELAGGVADAGDDAAMETLASLGAAVADHQVQEIREIEAALQRLRDGVYGVCVDCGEAIGAARLAAYPTAARCVACQARHEKTFSA
jgi:RNA polymerase-binding protein DksA